MGLKIQPGDVQRGPDDRAQARWRKDGWTAARQRAFFAHLGATCNVRHAARQAGMSYNGAYYRRRTDPVFRDRWARALEEGSIRQETMLLARIGGTADAAALRAAEAGDVDAAEALETMTQSFNTAEAMQLLSHHRKALHGGTRRRGGRLPGVATPDELADAILKQLDALKRRRGGPG